MSSISTDINNIELTEIDLDKIFKEYNIEIPPIQDHIYKFTENQLDGKGVFDVLMHSAEEHIKAEYDAGRITGANYSNIYLQTIQSVLQTSLQMVLQADTTWLEAEKLKLEVAQTRLQAEMTALQILEEQVKLIHLKLQIPLFKAKVSETQAQTQDIVDNNQPTRTTKFGRTTNIGGVLGAQIDSADKGIETADRTEALALTEKAVLSVFNAIESAEGVGANYYGLNGSNAVAILNNARKAFGVEPISTDNKYANKVASRINQYVPGAEEDTDDEK